MKIKVTKTTKAASCPLGIATKDYKAGETYEIHDSLAKVFISEGWGAEEGVVAKASNVKLEDKAVKAAEENKEEVKEETPKPITTYKSSFNRRKKK